MGELKANGSHGASDANGSSGQPQAGNAASVPEMHEIASLFLSRDEQRIISSADAIADKLTPEHIAKIIDNSAKDDEYTFRSFKWDKIVSVLILFASMAFAIALLILFQDSSHFEAILAAIFSFLGGLGLGRFSSGKDKS
jgi:hypothetical protein